MPTYEYHCSACDHRFEKLQSIKDSPIRKCPECGKLTVRCVIGGGAGIIFKGSGFYQTDYRSKSYHDAAKKEAPDSKGGKSSNETTSKKDSTEKSNRSSKG